MCFFRSVFSFGVASYMDGFMAADFFGAEFRVVVECLARGDNGGLCFDELYFFFYNMYENISCIK